MSDSQVLSELEVEEQNEGPSAETLIPDTESKQVPYARFKAVNDRAKEMAAKLAELEKASNEAAKDLEKRRQADLKAQEKYKELVEDLEAQLAIVSPKADKLEADAKHMAEVMEEYVKAQVEKVPEPYKEILMALPLPDRLAWLASNLEALDSQRLRGVPTTPTSSGVPAMTHEDRLKRAARTF